MSTAVLPAAAQRVLTVRHECDVAPVIAAAQRFCAAQGASAVMAAHVATAASELANNLWLHAERGGRISLLALARGPADAAGQVPERGVELRAEDDGPGIADPRLALTEGWSSAGGMGCGLPGVQRLMDDFELDTALGRGTRVVARKWWRPKR